MKFLRLEVLLLGLLVAPAAVAQSSLPQCPSDTKESFWTNCQGTRPFPNGDKYVGEWRDGKPNGQGTLTSPKGDKYIGEFRDGKPNGQGTFTLANGIKYIGGVSDGKMNGQGTLTFADGKKYVGTFSDNKANGHGTATLPDGGKYVGEFRDNAISGQGTMFAPDGSIKSGIWENNKFVTSASVAPSGSDKVTKMPQVVVPSTAVAQSRLSQCPSDTKVAWTDCQGTVTSTDGSKYVGEFRDNRPGGQGTLTWTNGSKYVGGFSKGKMNGQGMLTADGSKYVGGFSDGKQNGQGTLTWADGNKYIGGFSDGEMTGQGTMFAADGTKITSAVPPPKNVCDTVHLTSYQECVSQQMQADINQRAVDIEKMRSKIACENLKDATAHLEALGGDAHSADSAVANCIKNGYW